MDRHNGNRPNFIGVGGFKCATTWLSECLRYHPDIYMSTPKETHFFSKNWSKGKQWYEDHFKDSISYRAVGEFSTTYLQSPNSPKRIKELYGEKEIKIIIMIRNPIDRFISHYKHLYREGKIKNKSLNMKNFKRITAENPELLLRGIYSKGIKEYRELFGKENVLIMAKEDIDREPSISLKKVYNFLKVNEDFTPVITNKKVSEGIVPRFSFLEQLRVNLFKYFNKNIPHIITIVRKMRLADLYRKLNNRKERLVISQDVYEEILNYYMEDIERLENLLNRNLNKWKTVPK